MPTDEAKREFERRMGKAYNQFMRHAEAEGWDVAGLRATLTADGDALLIEYPETAKKPRSKKAADQP